MVTLSSKIREQLISSFGAELAEHVQTMTDGLLALEQDQVSGNERQETLSGIFRAAHSLKGAARALGVTAVEQLAHALENVLDLMQRGATPFTQDLFTVCFRALDTIQLVQAVYDSGGTTPPVQVLQTLAELEEFRNPPAAAGEPTPTTAPTTPADSGATALPSLRRPLPPRPAQETPRAAAVPAASPPAPAPAAPASAVVKPLFDADGCDTRQTPPPTPVGKREARPAPPSEPVEKVIWSDTPSQPPVEPAPPPRIPEVTDETVRVSVGKLDALMAQLSELLVTKIRSEQRLTQVHRTRDFVAQWQKEWVVMRKTYGRLMRKTREWDNHPDLQQDIMQLLEYVSTSQEQLRQLHTQVNTLAREYTNDTLHTALVIDTLEQEVKQVRMLPLNTITGAFGRMVRDLAQGAQKEATLHIVGGEVELDKRVLEQIKDPLIHLLRNAIDHGMETPEERTAAGKARSGSITLAAEQLGKEVVIRVSDDGRGLDLAAIRRAAQRKDDIGAAAETMTEAELVELIFGARFSTSPIITDVSGRGVGLDVVRRNVSALGGRINVDWILHQGATFTLILPMTLTSTRGLLVRAGGQRFAIPFSAIERILRVGPDEVAALGGHETIHHQGRPYPLVRLSDVLELPRTNPNGGEEAYMVVVIVATAERRMAFVVDGLEGEQEMVIKTTGKQLRHVGGIAGATVMGNGDVLLVLNVADLIKLAVRGEHRTVHPSVIGEAVAMPAPVAVRPQPRILVVDDSVTTRTLEKNVLEAAGYTVLLAVNGQEALGLIATGEAPDLIISDVVMPRLDGFGLTQQIKHDARTASIPVILVTSLDSPEDKTRGIEVGADAYIVKSHFDQNNLLETIEQLI